MDNEIIIRRKVGRKPLDYKTKTVSFRIREEWEAEIKDTVRKKISHLKKRHLIKK